jgi:hypothetical protein
MSVHDTSFAVYFAGDDAVIECEAIDPEAGPPECWPEWTDADRWEPTEADYQWAAENIELPPVGPSDADWEEYRQWSEWQDRLEGINGPHGITDEDLAAAGLPVG